ncbi:hypothetical protein BH09PAT3_BH09PAT3_3090 [soil metagenome]
MVKKRVMIEDDMQDNPDNKEPETKPVITSTDPQLLQPSQIPTPEPDEIEGEGGKSSSGLRDFGAFVGILAIAGVLAFLLISFLFRSYAVDGPSMETTLQNEDKLIIWKIPRTVARINGNQYLPNRGDVIIFTEDNLSVCGQEGERQLIKRVIGLPGDHVVVKEGAITIYNKDNLSGFSPDLTLPYNKDRHIPTTTGNIDVTLGDKQLFMSGDNRPDSCDSRAFGPISSDQIIGKLVLRLLPANKIKLF